MGTGYTDYEAEMLPAHELFARGSVNEAAQTSRDIGLEQAANSAASSIVVRAHAEELAALRETLLARIHVNTAQFFEHLIVDVLLRLGYGSRHRDLARCIGQSHDGGIDAVIARDELGLDVIYIQAKRLRPGSLVPASQVRDFVGSLESRKAAKGVFVTTARFSASAHSFLSTVPRQVKLIDGEQLASIMIRHNIGVTVRETYQFKDIAPEYFRMSPLQR
ncbi:MAG: restriction endonuclease [Hyphomicrobiales bacterium]